MELTNIKFSNYKVFEKNQEFDIRPITIIIGKNSAGKSSLLKLPLMIFNSFRNVSNGNLISLNYSGLDLGYEFRDLLYKKYETRVFKIKLDFIRNGESLVWNIGIQNFPELGIQVISEFQFTSDAYDISLSLNLALDSKDLYSGKINNQTIDNSQIAFIGLIPFKYQGDNASAEKTITDFFNEYSQDFQSIFFRVKYLMPLRAFPQRFYEKKTFDSSIPDFNGETVPVALFNDSDLFSKVQMWYKDNMDIHDITLDKIDRFGKYFEINIYQNDYSEVPVNLCDVGQGISQSLPIVVRAFMNRKDIVEIIEQPELHLHPAAHGNMANLFVDSSLANEGSKYIIETHSENFILRIRRLIAEAKIPKEWVSLYWISYDDEIESSTLQKIDLDENGEVSFWPEGIFSEAFEEVKAIRKAQRSNY